MLAPADPKMRRAALAGGPKLKSQKISTGKLASSLSRFKRREPKNCAQTSKSTLSQTGANHIARDPCKRVKSAELTRIRRQARQWRDEVASWCTNQLHRKADAEPATELMKRKWLKGVNESRPNIHDHTYLRLHGENVEDCV